MESRSQMPDYETADEEFRYDIDARHRSGTIWRVVFQLSTIVGIIALTALLYNVINQSFGYAAVENSIAPDALVRAAYEEELLSAPRVVASEDDNVLVDGIAGNPYAVGFFGYAYYQQNVDRLDALTVSGVEPTSETVDSGEYPLARPLYIYTTADLMRSKPQVAGFLDYYLTFVDDVIDDVGYFQAEPEDLAAAKEKWLEATDAEPGQEGLPSVDPTALDGEIVMAGSSTVFPLSSRIVERFREDGFTGLISVDNIGTSAGFRLFCVEGSSDIVNASRPITQAELKTCEDLGRTPIGFRVGTDAVAVVVSESNDFAENVTFEQVRAIFNTAETWSDANSEWPAEPIERFIPGADSGTLDFFVEAAYDVPLSALDKATLVGILEANVSTGLFRRFESEMSWDERAKADVYQLVLERVVEPEIQETWSLYDSIFYRDAVETAMLAEYPNAELEFRSWVNPSFVVNPQSRDPERAGVRTAILGSLWVITITLLTAFPVGVGAAIYLEEYAPANWITGIIRTNINNLAGVPSIIYGLLGLAIFVRALESFTSGTAFGAADPTTANGRTIVSAGLTLALLILPLIIINAQEAIRAVPDSLRRASYGLGATKWQTIWHHVLPNAITGILTGTILAMSRAVGETAPLVVVGASTFITHDPDGPFSKFTVLPIQIWQWTTRPQDEFRNIAAGAIIVLLILLLTLNASAVLLRNRYSQRL